MTLPEGVTDADVKKALTEGHRYAKRRARGSSKLEEIATDSATDGVVWACQRFDKSRGVRFSTFASSAVEKFVWRGIAASVNRHLSNPTTGELSEAIEAPARMNHDDGRDFQLPEAVQELPAELRDTVRLFYVDKFDFRDIGLLMGCGMETARCRLKAAAEMLAGETAKRHRPTGTKRMRR